MLTTIAHDSLIDVQDLAVDYGNHDGAPALQGVTFSVPEGARVAIIGPNGAGKSTLLKAIMGLLTPSKGAITFAGGAIPLGYVPQHEEVAWDFPVNVRDVVMMGCARQIGWLRRPTREHYHRVDEAIARVGLTAFARRQVGQLSGGQRRRVFIARALAQGARALILDEPFSGVDVSAQAELLDTLDALNAGGLTILLSTHDLDLAYRRFDRVLAINHRLIAYGTPEQVYTTDTLAQLYGTRLIVTQAGQPIGAFFDDHACENCT